MGFMGVISIMTKSPEPPRKSVSARRELGGLRMVLGFRVYQSLKVWAPSMGPWGFWGPLRVHIGYITGT